MAAGAAAVTLSRDEQVFANRCFCMLDLDGDGQIGTEGALFLARAALPRDTLAQIWALAAGEGNNGTLNSSQFHVAMRLVASAQSCGEASLAALEPQSPPLPLPEFALNPPSPDTSPPSMFESGEQYLRIGVIESSTVGSAVSRHTRYVIVTETSLASFPVPRSQVQRRFRDLLWLHGRLRQHFRSTILPAPPEKRFNNMNDAFLESRRQQLEVYLNAVAAHPKLHSSFELQVFLTATDEGLESAKELMPLDQAVHGPVVPSSTITESAVSTVTSGLSSLWGSVKSGLGMNEAPPPVELDNRFDHVVEQVNADTSAIEMTIARVVNATEELVRVARHTHYELGRLGYHCGQMGAQESSAMDDMSDGSSASAAIMWERFSVATDAVAERDQDMVDRTDQGFLQTMRQAQSLNLGVRDVLRMRERAVAEVNDAHGSLFRNKKRHQSARAEGNTAKASEAERKMALAEARIAVGSEQALHIAQNLNPEYAAHKEQKRAMYAHALCLHARQQINHARNVQSAWEGLLMQLAPTEQEQSASMERISAPVTVPQRRRTSSGGSGVIATMMGAGGS